MSSFKKAKGKGRDKNVTKSERIPNEIINYYKRVSETLNEEFSSEEDKDIFLTNVFAQFKEDGAKVCRLSGISRVLEKLITCASATHIQTVLSVLSCDWTSVITDRIASHVLQHLIGQIPKHLDTAPVTDEEETTNVKDLFLELCDHVCEQLNVYWSDTYGSHIIRVILQVLGSVSVNEQVIRSRLSRNQQKDEQTDQFPSFEPPEDFKKNLKIFSKNIFSKDILKDGIYCSMGNPVIQTLLLIYHKHGDKRCQKYLKKIVVASQLCQTQATDQKQSLPAPVTHEIGSYLVEQILNLGSEQLFQEVYEGALQGRLLLFAVHPVANFVLQRYLSDIKNKEHFEEIFTDLSHYMEDILAVNHLGVVTRMAETCLRLGCKQEKMVKCLMKAFHCFEPAERKVKFVPLVASLTTYDVFFGVDDDDDDDDTKDDSKKEENKETKVPILQKINFHGALLLQHLLKFGNPKFVINGLVNLKPVELRALSCDPCGSHVIDVFCQSSAVGEKSRDLLFNRMKDIYTEMACSRNGSRTLEVMWKTASMGQKVNIAQQLSKQESKIRGDQYGHFIHRNFALFHFLHRRKDWEELQSNKAKKRKLFSDILSDQSSAKKSNRKETEKQMDIAESGDEGESNSLRLDDEEDTSLINQTIAGTRCSSTEGKFEKKSKQRGNFRPKQPKMKQSSKSHSKEYRIKDKSMLNLLNEIDGGRMKKKRTK